jgi:hypothetical protein
MAKPALNWRPISRILDAIGPVFGLSPPLRAHSSLHPHVQMPFAHHPDVGQRKQRHQIGRVLGQPPVLDLDVGKLALDDPKRVLYLGAYTRFGLLQLVQDGPHGGVFLQGLAFARAHGHMPVHIEGLSLLSLGHTLVAGVGEHIDFLAMKKAHRLGDITDVGRRADDGVHQARLRVHTDMGLHAEVPLVALLRLVHLGVASAGAVLGGSGRGDQRGIHQCSGLEHQPLLGQARVDRLEDLRRQLMFFQQVTEAKNGGFVRNPHRAGQPRKLPIQRPLVKLFFHGRVAQVPPQLKAVNAQHHFNGKRRAPTQRLARATCMRRNQRHQLRPRHDPVHFFKEDFFAGLLGQGVKAEEGLVHVRYLALSSDSNPVGLTRGFAEVPQ